MSKTNPQFTHTQTTFGESVLSRRRQVFSRVAILTQLEQLKQTGRYDCFKLKWHPTYDDKSAWPVPPHLFWDSDLAKWIEGACYFLPTSYDAEVDAAIRHIVSTIQEAQQPDGYLNLHYTVVEPGKRWTNLRDMHELYNAGHLIEAAIAHHEYYGNNDLLEPVQKYVALISKTFGPNEGQIHGYPGHPEIELALFRLYKATGDQSAYDLARYFVEERGNPSGQDGTHYFDWEREKLRNESAYMRPDTYPTRDSHWYDQSHLPILEQDTVEGHSVRCMYLLVAVADMITLARDGRQQLTKVDQWLDSTKRLWRNMVDKKMYVTGGVGAIKQWEGFGLDYFLPQSTDEGGCYAETCASIGVMMLAERLLTTELDSEYADIMELCLYNAVMTAMSLDGKAFTYVNQLASSDQDLSAREDWFEVSCCPPNMIRLFGTLGGYLWHAGEEGPGAGYINVHLYTSAKVAFQVHNQTVSLEQETNWPWEGTVNFKLSGAESLQMTARLRIPSWANQDFTLSPAAPSARINKGYLILDPEYLRENPRFSLSVGGFAPRFVAPHPYTRQRTLTVARGPIIYCIEDADHEWESNHFKDVVIKTSSTLKDEPFSLGSGDESFTAVRCSEYWKIDTDGWNANGSKPSKQVSGSEALIKGKDNGLLFVPYYMRANRGGKGHMRVGVARD